MTESYEDLLALLIINNENFSDAYQLCKVLSWKFGVINCSEIINRIEARRYIITAYPKSTTLKFFSLTSEGRNRLQEEIDPLIRILREEFPEEVDFIDKLGSGSNKQFSQ
jgi:DNA-binding PadR family transcriptional regulator